MGQIDPREQAKQQVGIEAARMAQPGSVVGLGTGSTAAYAIEELGRRVREEQASFVGIPTSFRAEALARRHGIPIQMLNEVSKVDLTIDGADEVDPQKNLIKGVGGAHTLEKIVASFAKNFVVVVDETKLVDRLGNSAPVPVEVLPQAEALVKAQVRKFGGMPQLRMAGDRSGHREPFRTEYGNIILDVWFQAIEDPKTLECSLNNIPGVVENGLFVKKAHLVLVGSISDGTVRRLE